MTDPTAMGVEGHPGRVVHGASSQRCLMDLPRDHVGAVAIADLIARARCPM
jgi:hypothetical protein